MDKNADHLRRVSMPGRWKQESEPGKKPNVLSDDSTDFGFGKNKHTPGSKGRLPLDDAYGFWSKNRSAANMDRLLQAAQPTINNALSSFAGGDKSMTPRAKRLVVEAVKSFDPNRGTKLGTHLMIRLQPLQREYTHRSSIVAVPERVQLDKFRLEQAERAMTDELGREPSDAELSDRTGFSSRRIAHIRSFARRRLAESQMKSPEGETSQQAAEAVTPEDIWAEYVHYDLDPIDKKILEWKTGMYNKKVLSTNEIARRLKITPSAVSQRAAKIAMKMENVGG